VVVHIIDVERIRIDKAENHALVCTNCYCPKALVVAFEWMQPETWQIHIGHRSSRVEPRQNIAQLNDVLCDNAARVVLFMKTFQTLVPYRPDHSKS
jgi:hypothetical protein